MKTFIKICIFFISTLLFSQTDYSENWEDLFSYNNVKDFVKIDSKIYALVDNAIFIYDEITQETSKMSSVNGLSGETATSLYYSENYKKLVIGYATGLVEILDENGKITIEPDISNFPLSSEKEILNIAGYDNNIYLSTPFAIVVYNLESLSFGDTYFIGSGSTEVRVNEIAIANEIIYAATENGIYTANINNPNLIDFNNWTKHFNQSFTTIEDFNNEVYTSVSQGLYRFTQNQPLQLIRNYSSNILNLKSSLEYLSVSILRQAHVYNLSLSEVTTIDSDENSEYYFQLNATFAKGNNIYLATKEFGILKTNISNTVPYQEIHPEGPTSNGVFSITAANNNLWVVYGGHSSSYVPLGNRFGFSHYNGENWTNTGYDSSFSARDLVNIAIDPDNENKVYLSSWNDGIAVVEDDKITEIWDESNSEIEEFAGFFELISDATFDRDGNLWAPNTLIESNLVKRTPNGTWSKFSISEIMPNNAYGLNQIIIDKTDNKWIGSRRNGALVYNENGDRKRALTTEATKGSLPHLNVRTIAVDSGNRIWIGTQAGMVVFYNAAGVFDADIYDAEPIIILDDGVAKKLLGDQPINSIAVDGADNKWFATDRGGALQTTPNGRETLNIFNTTNSPLPSNTILKVKVDLSNGKVFFATDKGIVAYNNKIASYGDELGEVYAYPNPVRKQHNFVTIDGRNGEHLPQGTNVKILDSAGYLVYETNVEEGQELFGGKVVWDKTNLAGEKVSSGVYIVLLTNEDSTETSSTKIAIIN